MGVRGQERGVKADSRIWLPLKKKKKNRLGIGIRNLILDVKFKMPIGQPSGTVDWAVGYTYIY